MSTYKRSGSSRNKSSSRRRTRRGRPRYDRIVGAAAVLIVFMILFVSCCKSCGDNDSKKDETSTYDTSSQEDGKNNDDSKSDDSSLAGLESFSTVSEMPNAVFEGDLILVNKQHEYSFPASVKNSDNDSSESEDSGDNGEEEQSGEMEVSGDIVPVYTKISDSYQVCDYETSLSSDTILAINSMMDKFYEKTGLNDTMIIGGYRTKEYQDEKYNSGSSDIKGGCSEFHTGLSFDLGIFPEGENSYYYTPEGDYSWILENCANYGFILRYPEGKEDLTGMDSKSYQFRYVGIPHAIYIMQNDMCFEEYIEFVKNYTYDSEHLTVAGPDKNYEIYYVPADPSANTDVPVPADKTYEISGNNVDGFIVTVEK